MSTIKSIVRYLLMALGIALLIIGLNNCDAGSNQQQTSTPPPTTSTPTTPPTTTSSTNTKPKININTAILSELDKLEAQLAIPALSNKIQASRPYGTTVDLVSKNVITQEQFDKIKDQVTVEDIVLTGEAKDIDFMTKLALMKGHMIVAGELLDLKKPEQAEPHIGHPVEEIYADIQEQLPERKVPEFSDVLTNVQNLVKSKPNDSQLKPEFTKAMGAIEGAIATLPESQRQSPGFVLRVINGMLDVAGAEYTAAITNGKISEIIEYQDSRGFVIYATDLFKQIEPTLSKNKADASNEIQISLATLFKAWPSAIPPAAPVKSPDEVVAQIKNIEKLVDSVTQSA